MLGFIKSVTNGKAKPLAKISAAELKNILEQERILTDAVMTQRMLTVALSATMRHLAKTHNLPDVFELNRQTGDVFAKEASDG